MVVILFIWAVTGARCQGVTVNDMGEIGGEIFGRGGGYVHPFVSVSSNYTDNVYYDPDHAKADFYTLFSPGILVMVPGTKAYDPSAAVLSISTPGGLLFSKDLDGVERRFHGRLLMNADVEDYREYNDNDVTTSNVEGGVQINLKGGLSLDMIYQHQAAYEDRSMDNTDGLSEYHVDMANGIIYYRLSEKMDFRLECRLFAIEYDRFLNQWNDRRDVVASGYAYYRLTPKTSFYIGYDHTDIRYDRSADKDSLEDDVMVGVRWYVSDKTRGSAAIGYGVKDFKDPAVSNSTDVTTRFTLSNRLTGKSYINLTGYRRTSEADVDGGQYSLTNSVMAGYFYKIHERISMTLHLSYTDDRYVFETGGRKKDRSYGVTSAIGYSYNQWLVITLAYALNDRDSSREDADYLQHGVSAEIRAVL